MKQIIYIMLFLFAGQNISAQNNEDNKNDDILDMTYHSGNIWINESFYKNAVAGIKKANFTLEYICVDRIEDEIKRRKLEFPMVAYRKIKTNDSIYTLPSSLYYTSFELPVENYNPDSVKSFETSFLRNKKHMVQVCLIPRSNNSYTVIIKHYVDGFNYIFGQVHTYFTFTNGKKFKLLLSRDKLNLSDENDLIRFYKNNVWRFVDEYILLSLEE